MTETSIYHDKLHPGRFCVYRQKLGKQWCLTRNLTLVEAKQTKIKLDRRAGWQLEGI